MSETTLLILSWAGCTLAMTGMVFYLRRQTHHVISGMLIAFIALICDAVCLLYYDYPWISSFRAIPLLMAGFFATPLTAIVAGILSAVGAAAEYVFVFAPPAGLERWVHLVGGVEAFSTLLVAGYAIAIRRFILDNQPPNFIQAGVMGCFGEFVHIGTTFLITGVFTRMAATGMVDGADLTALGLEFLYSFYPDTLIGAGVILAVVCLLAGGRKTWEKDLHSPFSLCVLLFGGVTFFITCYSEYLAYQSTAKALATAREKLNVQLEDQIGYMLHRNAITLRDKMKTPQAYSIEEMQKFAETFDVNEINIFSRDRKVLASNLESVKEHNRDGVPLSNLRDFFELCRSNKEFVKNQFRASCSDSHTYAKYIGVPFPDRSAFLQMGYSWDHLLEEFPTFFFPMFDTARIGNNGYFIVTDWEGNIVAPIAGHPGEVGKTIFESGLKKAQWELDKETLFEANLFGEWSHVSWNDGLEQYRVYAVIPNTEYYTPALRMATMILFLLFAIAFTFRVLMLRNAHTQAKLDAMRKGDMELAASIQNSELNKTPLDTPHCSVTAEMTPAREVGGDFFDYCLLSNGCVAFAIADVSGKGVPAAFVMMKAHSVLKSCIYNCASLTEAMHVTNKRLQRDNRNCMFVTAWIGIFDPANRTVEYVSAGHNPPFVRRADGKIEWIKEVRKAKPLGLFADVKYESKTFTLSPGDTLYLYTDGVTEAMNQRGELYGERRLETAAQNAQGDLIHAVTEDLDAFTGKAPQADDITMLTLEVKNEPNC